MIKSLLLFPLLGIWLFTSCKKAEAEERYHEFHATGELKSLQTSSWQYGTHTIHVDDKFYALRSDSIDLHHYNQKIVQIWGVKDNNYPVNGGPEYIIVKKVELLNQEKSQQAFERVIFDTDVGGDVDDAGALAVLHALADRREIELLAMGVVIGHEAAVPYVHAINTWYGRPNLPIGTIKGPAPYSRDEFMAPIVAAYPHSVSQQTAPDVVKLYRKVLASQPDRSVTLIAVGPATNIYNLLKSTPDEHSPLTGTELMRKKVKFYAAGGNGRAGLPKGFCGFNYATDLFSASTELQLLPTEFPTVFAGGSGMKLEIGAALNKARPDHIIRKSYESYYKGAAKNRFTWDQQRVLYACRPSSRTLWETSASGTIEMGLDGVLIYHSNPDKNRAFAYVKNFGTLEEQLTNLMMYDPRDK